MAYDYQGEFESYTSGIQDSFQEMHTLAGAEKRKKIAEIDELFSCAEETVKNMGLNRAPAESIAACKRKVNSLRVEYERIKNPYTAERERLFSHAAAADLRVTSEDQRARLLQTSDKLEEGSSHLHNARLTMEDTLHTARDINTTLYAQREQMLHQRDMLQQVNDQLSSAGSILRGMARRMMTNKAIMVVIKPSWS
eukprot:CAMPEP_0177644090 /NCGR_PEP_ID=MMETSP0447-20121125/8494_1 /TAXON_ID=0 /ORGANISM="Stygamoeba regulata, Strain BSH-02190019" /LENGTH=195 /DNA_ID=CAMNT_0019146411 /DNA_START=84 /DNA_END=672 /DNA_ORIENTATION=-